MTRQREAIDRRSHISITDRACPDTATAQPSAESLQRLTKFSRDMGHMTSLPAIAERILSGLSEVVQYPEASLYLVEREREQFHRFVTQGSTHATTAPSTVPIEHPFVHQLAQHHQILDRSVLADGTDSSDPEDLLARMFKAPCSSLAVPLVNRGRLIAFAVLQSAPTMRPADLDSVELLTAMAQSAANALDSLLVYEDLHQSQTLMRRTDRLRSLEIIAGGFAHEIRNPLTSIKTFIQLAPERKDDVEFIQDFSRVVLDDVHRIERLIGEILDYARYMEPKLTDEDVNDIVSSCLYFIAVKADSRGIKIEKELAPDLPRAMLDRQQIKQVLLNLLLNAMDAIGERGGTLRVKTNRLVRSSGNTWIQIEIEDTGQGISAVNLEHIFDPFFTTKHTSGENAGTGLGLTIAHQIIREHQGEIRVQSTEGVGTNFRINLPSLA
jgi:signal transduction histidine kinase